MSAKTGIEKGETMRKFGLVAAAALAAAAAACSQGSSDNVMAPEANALDPADVNAALGPEITAIPDSNLSGNEIAGVDNSAGTNAVEAEPANTSDTE
jgi:hypothetical protein